MSLNEETIVASYKIMNHITKGYQWYHDTPEQPFEWSEGSIWLINPKTKEWMLELEKSGDLWYFHEIYHIFSRYLNMDVSDIESFIKIWMEDALERGVVSTWMVSSTRAVQMEDALERGVVSTIRLPTKRGGLVEDALERGVVSTGPRLMLTGRRVEDALERGVVSTIEVETMEEVLVEDALERGVAFTNNGLEYHKKNKFVELCLSFLRKIKR